MKLELSEIGRMLESEIEAVDSDLCAMAEYRARYTRKPPQCKESL